jgi:hypothetical protein
MEINYAKLNTEAYLPGLIKLIGKDHNFGWTKIDSLFNKIIQKRIVESGGETMLIPATIFDIIWHAKKDDPSAKLLLGYFNSLFDDLASHLSDREKQVIKPIITNTLKSSDHRYWDYIGEIAVLNNLIRTDLYIIEKIERKITNGKSIDFCLKEKSTCEFKHVEVVSIHLDPKKVSADSVLIRKFLEGRITQKIENKEKFTEDRNSYLIPVLRGSAKDLQTYSNFFKTNDFKIDRVIEPLAFLTFTSKEGKFVHHFGRISKLFEPNFGLSNENNKNYLDGTSNTTN